MEMLSNASKYALNADIYLATESSKDKKFGSKEIASAINVPSPFLAKLLQDLVKKDIISSAKGPGGGFYLSEENIKQPLLCIIAHIDGLSRFKECVLGLAACSDQKPCPLHFAVQPFKTALYEQLSANSIETFAAKVKSGETFLVSMP